MILSYHPIFIGDKNLICAGRIPDEEDLKAILAADAVILPQGCPKELFYLARKNCRHVFPDFHAKFKYPGKLGQIHLFREKGIPHPRTHIYASVDAFHLSAQDPVKVPPFAYPFIFKFNWGGEGQTVFLLKSPKELFNRLEKARSHESSGRKGFLLQEYVPAGNKALRVVVIGQRLFSYWRVQENKEEFRSNLSTGSKIDTDSELELQDIAVSATRQICHQTGINLAGFDVLFSSENSRKTPLFLEINYFFGREALGGSQAFYQLLTTEINNWIRSLDLGNSSDKSSSMVKRALSK